MDSRWLTSRRRDGLKKTGNLFIRFAAAVGMVAVSIGPAVQGAPTAQAGALEFTDIRPPYTQMNDTTAPYAALTTLGTTNHYMAVAPNGDIFMAGGAPGAPALYKSTDGGMSWSQATLPAGVTAAGVTINGIAVSPDYPSDPRAFAVFGDGGAGANDGVIVSTNAASQTPLFTVLQSGPAAIAGNAGAYDAVSIAISPNFDGRDNAGEVAIGIANGAGVQPTVYAYRAGGTAAPVAIIGSGGSGDVAGAATRALAYSPRFSSDGVLAEVRTFGGNTVARVTEAGEFRTPVAADTITGTVATEAALAFPSDYTQVTGGGTYWAALGGTAADGVYKHIGGAWSLQTGSIGGDIHISSLAATGTADNATLVAAEGAGQARVLRSSNGGTTWTSRDQANASNVINAQQLGAANQQIGLSPNYSSDQTVYLTNSSATGGFHISKDRGSNFQDGGISNTAATATGFTDIGGVNGSAFVTAGGMLWKTTNLGTGATWQRVHRATTTGTVVVPTGFASHQTVYVRLTALSGTDQFIKSIDGGLNFSGASTPDETKTQQTLSCSSATMCWTGDTDGNIYYTTDGLRTWTKSSTDVGQGVRSFTRSPNFSTDNTIFVQADSNSGTTEVWMSTDGGATWTQQGTAQSAWKSGSGLGSLAVSPNFADDKMIFFRPGGASEVNIYRYTVGGTADWEKLGAPSSITGLGTMSVTSASGVGDGIVLYVLNTTPAGAGNHIMRTYYPKTVNETTWTDLVTNGVQNAPDLRSAFTRVASSGAQEFFSVVPVGGVTPGRILTWTDTAAFNARPAVVQPLDTGSVASCSGINGQVILFSWNTIERVQSWDLEVALDKDFRSKVINATTFATAASSNPIYTVGPGGSSACVLVDGQTYHWRVRAHSASVTLNDATVTTQQPGPWSEVRSFSVGTVGAPTAPQPQLPADGATMPNLGPTQLSWNNPSGTTQFHIQVLPLNNDGPAIDLIIGEPSQVAAAGYTVMPPVFGQGNYVMLPGATYNWRVRTTRAPGSVGVNDSSWGPWSDVRTFKTPRPSAASIQVQPVTPSANPTISWKDSNTSNFYYEVQLSEDRTFNADPATATAAVYWNLVHGGESNPLNSWTLPDGTSLESGKTYYARVRQRVQATPLGADEPGIGWSSTVSFVVP